MHAAHQHLLALWEGQELTDSPEAVPYAMHLQVAVEIIDYSDLEMGKFLGQGAEGTVHAAWYLETPVAVKQTSSVQEIEMNLHAGKRALPMGGVEVSEV